MTGILYIDGLTDGKELWNAIDRHQVFKNVSRLQARIVKAVKEEDKKKALGFQRLLARSRSTSLLAMRRVTSNRGKRTVGVDKVKLNTSTVRWQE
jgi:RNA-directed DNA polymerase